MAVTVDRPWHCGADKVATRVDVRLSPVAETDKEDTADVLDDELKFDAGAK